MNRKRERYFSSDINIDTKCVHSYTHPRIVKTLRKIKKIFIRWPPQINLFLQGGAPPCIFMRYLCIYASFMHLLCKSCLIVLHILSMSKWHIFGLKTATLSHLRALGGLKCFTTKERETIERKQAKGCNTFRVSCYHAGSHQSLII